MSSALPPLLIYLHGFNSSPASFKAQMLLEYMRQRGLETSYLIPELANSPGEAVLELQSLLDSKLNSSNITLLGSSLGGYYATCLAEMYPVRAVLVNPSVDPASSLAPYIGINDKIYSDESYEFTRDHLEQLKQLKVPHLSKPERYLVLVQTGDETLDYREAAEFYAACDLRVEEGGSHGYTGFERVIPQILMHAGFAGDKIQGKLV